MRIKKILAVTLWALIGLAINTQFDPTTVIGSVMGSAFIFIWIGLLIIGIFAWIKLMKWIKFKYDIKQNIYKLPQNKKTHDFGNVYLIKIAIMKNTY